MARTLEDLNRITERIIGAAIEVHRTLGGPGLLESVYEEALAWELTNAGLNVQRQIEVPIRYKGRVIGHSLRLDLLVEDAIVVECKAVGAHNPLFEAQVLTYLRVSERRLGLVLNFGLETMKEGIHRVISGF